MKTYTLTLNEEQLRELSQASELITRFKIGQFNYLDTLFFEKDFNRQDLDYCMQQAKLLVFPELESNSSYGMYSDKVPEDAKVLWDIHKVIAHQLDNGEYYNVNSKPHSFYAGKYKVKISEGE